MKRVTKFIVTVSLILSLCVNLFSCDREYDEEVIKAVTPSLIEESLILNEIYWGEGIPYIPSTSSVYCEANFIALSELGFYTIDELKEKTDKVFSKKYCEYIFHGFLLSSVFINNF